MILGYARVSTQEQNLDRQIDQLKTNGAEKIYTEKMTGTKKERPALNELIEFARPNDTILICDLSRISRSTKDLIYLVESLGQKEINIKSLQESWLDTGSAQGKLMFTIMAGLVQFERDLTSERIKDGLKAARARGRKGGRPFVKKQVVKNALTLYDSKQISVNEICKTCGISKGTLYKYIDERKR